MTDLIALPENNPISKDEVVVTLKKTNEHSKYVRFNSWLKVSINVEQGNVRKTMEDRTLVSHFHYKNKDYYLNCILDGHGGTSVCDMIVSRLTPTFQKYLVKHHGSQIRQVIDETFVDLHNQVKKLKLDSGSTVSLLLIIDKKEKKQLQVWSANVGDSAAYGILEHGKKIRIQKITTDHNLEHKTEKARLEKLKDYRFQDGYIVAPTGDAINMSRAVGDITFDGAVLPNPSIRKLTKPYSIFMISSDGIWDVVDQRVLWAKLCPKIERKNWRLSAERLNSWRNQAFKQHDNTSLMIIYLDHEKYKHHKEEEDTPRILPQLVNQDQKIDN